MSMKPFNIWWDRVANCYKVDQAGIDKAEVVLYTDVQALEESRDRWKRLAKAYKNPAIEAENDNATCDEHEAAWQEIHEAEAALTLAGEEV